jgi:hypothetical protein
MRGEYEDRMSALEAARVARDQGCEDGVRAPTRKARETEKFMPEMWTAENDAMWSGEKNALPFSDFAHEIEDYLMSLDPLGSGKRLMEWAAALKELISVENVEDIDLDERYPLAKTLNSALAKILAKVTKGAAKIMVEWAGPGNGFRAWQNLERKYRPRSAMYKSIPMLMNPGISRDMGELHRRLEEWEVAVREHEARFDDEMQENVKIEVLMSMIPRDVYEQRFKGRSYDNYNDLRQEIQIKASRDPVPMDIGEPQEKDDLTKMQETMDAAVTGKDGGKHSEEMCAVTGDHGGKGAWVKVTAVIDSKSTKNAPPPGAVPFASAVPSEGSRSGEAHGGAGVEAMLNQGQKIMAIKTLEGQIRGVKWQVCHVAQPLMNVARVIAAGNHVHLGKKDLHIMDLRTGVTTELHKEGNVFEIDFWVRKPNDATCKTLKRKATESDGGDKAKSVKVSDPDGNVAMSGFTGQGW